MGWELPWLLSWEVVWQDVLHVNRDILPSILVRIESHWWKRITDISFLSPTSLWLKQKLSFDAACLLEACQPGCPLRPQAKFHTQEGIFLCCHRKVFWQHSVVESEERGSPCFLFGEILFRCFLFQGFCWLEKREQEVNLFFAVIIESGT